MRWRSPLTKRQELTLMDRRAMPIPTTNHSRFLSWFRGARPAQASTKAVTRHTTHPRTEMANGRASLIGSSQRLLGAEASRDWRQGARQRRVRRLPRLGIRQGAQPRMWALRGASNRRASLLLKAIHACSVVDAALRCFGDPRRGHQRNTRRHNASALPPLRCRREASGHSSLWNGY